MRGFLRILSLGFLALALYYLVQGVRSDKWPSTPGTADRVVGYMSSPGLPGRHSFGSEGQASVVVAYHYEAMGRRFSGSRLCWGEFPGFPPVGLRALLAHPTFDSIPVYYDPASPSTSVLIPGVQGPAVFAFAFIGVFIWAFTSWLFSL